MNGVNSSEPRMFDPEVEEKGSQAILAGLTEEEIKSMPDANMPLRDGIFTVRLGMNARK